MTRYIHTNYLSIENGCKILQASSQTSNGPSSNILNNIRNKVWVTDAQPPQYCIIDIKTLINKPQIFNSIAFDCWLDYDTNPALIQIAVKYQNSPFTTVAKIRLEKKNGWQDFKINEINAKQAKLLKVTIQQNFGGQQIYLNQIALSYHNFEQEIKNSYSSKERVLAEASRLTSSERQLKKANQKIKDLEQEILNLKSELKNHQDIMLKMQQTMKKMAQRIQLIDQKQQAQDQKLKHNPKRQQSIERTADMKSYKQTTKQSYKNKDNQIYKKQVYNRRDNYQNKLQQDSEISLSEYSQSPMPNSNYTSMLQNLQKLMAIREQKKSLLKKQKNSKTKKYRKQSSSQDSNY